MKALQTVGHQRAPDESTLFMAALVVAWRFSLSGLLLLATLVKGLAGFTLHELRQGTGLGICGGVGLILQMDGLAYTSGSTSAFLTQGYCVWIPLWLVVISRQWPSKRLLIATAAVVFGAAVLAGISPSNWQLGRGEWETLVGSMLFAGQILWLERPVFRANNALRSTLVMFVVLAATGWAAALVLARDRVNLIQPLLNVPALSLIAILVLVCTIATFPLANHWQPKVSATQAGLLYCTEPVFTSAVCLFFPGLISMWWGVDYPNETITWHLTLGGLLILAANGALQIWPVKPGKSAD